MQPTILIIEDDENTAALITVYFEGEGFKTVKTGNGRTGLALAKQHEPDLVILDLMLPEVDGWEVCRQLRRRSNVPIIMLTARGEELDRVSGLSLGADDYVVKPFSPRELVERVKAVLRRVQRKPEEPEGVIAHATLLLDLNNRRFSVAGRSVDLTPHEYNLLKTLMTAPGRTFTRDELLDRLYPLGDATVIDRVVDVHIGKLRQKIEPNPAEPEYILTVRGIGYRFADQAAPDSKDGT
jgi:DNA-binding response OmpR family regulator